MAKKETAEVVETQSLLSDEDKAELTAFANKAVEVRQMYDDELQGLLSTNISSRFIATLDAIIVAGKEAGLELVDVAPAAQERKPGDPPAASDDPNAPGWAPPGVNAMPYRVTD